MCKMREIMKNKLVKLSAVALAVGLSASAFAVTKQGAYVGGQLGAMFPTINPSSESDGFGGTIKVSSNHIGAGLLAGYQFQVAPQFFIGPEIGLNYLGSFTTKISGGPLNGASETDAAWNWDVLAVANYNINKVWGVFAKAGMTQQIMSFGDGNDGTSSQTLGLTAQAGAGVSYNINQNMEVTAEYSHIFGKSFTKVASKSDSVAYNNIWFGFKYNF